MFESSATLIEHEHLSIKYFEERKISLSKKYFCKYAYVVEFLSIIFGHYQAE